MCWPAPASLAYSGRAEGFASTKIRLNTRCKKWGRAKCVLLPAVVPWCHFFRGVLFALGLLCCSTQTLQRINVATMLGVALQTLPPFNCSYPQGATAAVFSNDETVSISAVVADSDHMLVLWGRCCQRQRPPAGCFFGTVPATLARS